MAHFTLPFDGRGPLVRLMVTVSEARGQALIAAGKPIPNPQLIAGLVDTGASGTCIDPTILAALELTPTGSCEMKTPSTGDGAHTVELYDVALGLWASTELPPLVLPTLPVMATPLLSQGFGALIGRDLLARCVLVYNGSEETFTLAF